MFLVISEGCGVRFSNLLKKSRFVIARSDYCDAAISKCLIILITSLLRFARKDSEKTVSADC